MVNSTVCPLCVETIGCQMDDEHAAIVKEMLAALKEVKAVFEAAGATDVFNAQYAAVTKAIAKAEGRR